MLFFLQRHPILLHYILILWETVLTSTLCYSSSRDNPYFYITHVFYQRQPIFLHYVILAPETTHTSTLRSYSIRHPILLHYVILCSETPHTSTWCYSFFRDSPFFYIMSVLSPRVLDIEGGDSSEGTNVITYGKNDDQPDNQLWYEDGNGCIRSKLNDFCIDSRGELRSLQWHHNERDGVSDHRRLDCLPRGICEGNQWGDRRIPLPRGQ